MIEVHDQAAQVAILGVARHDQHGLAIGTRRQDRIGIADEVGVMTVEGHCRIGRIAHALVTAAGHHHVDTADQASEVLVALQSVELINHHDLVHAQSLERVDCRLQVSSHLLQIAGRGVCVILWHRAVRGGLAQQFPGRGTDEADLLTVDGLDRIRSNARLEGGHFRTGDGTGGTTQAVVGSDTE